MPQRCRVESSHSICLDFGPPSRNLRVVGCKTPVFRATRTGILLAGSLVSSMGNFCPTKDHHTTAGWVRNRGEWDRESHYSLILGINRRNRSVRVRNTRTRVCLGAPGKRAARQIRVLAPLLALGHGFLTRRSQGAEATTSTSRGDGGTMVRSSQGQQAIACACACWLGNNGNPSARPSRAGNGRIPPSLG